MECKAMDNHMNKEAMKAFLASLGITRVRYNELASKLNQRPVFDALSPKEALASAKEALKEYESTTSRVYGRDVTTFTMPGLGIIRISVHPVFGDMPMPVHVIPGA